MSVSIIQKHSGKRVIIVLLITFFYMILEFAGGIISNSLSLLADAGHMLADVSALLMSLFAFIIAKKPKTTKATFGYYRAEILAALFNALLLLLVSFVLLKEAFTRLFFVSEHIDAKQMFFVAIGGLLVNIASLFVLWPEKHDNLNTKGVFLHVLSDTLGSVGVVFSSLAIEYFSFTFADTIASVLISLLIIASSLSLLFESIAILMERVPAHIEIKKVKQALIYLDFTMRVHDLHIWTIASGIHALSAHVEVKSLDNYETSLKCIENLLKSEFGITHTTIQLECKSDGNEKRCVF